MALVPSRLALSLLAVVTPALLSACVSDSSPSVPEQPSFYRSMAAAGMQVDGTAAASMISGFRANNGLGSVTIDPALTKLAQEQALAMASRDKLDHDVVRSFDQRLLASGYNAKLGAENIGAGYHTLAEAFSGWRDSPHHRQNMLMRGVTRIGIATAYAPKSKYKVFWALILAAPDDRRG